MIWFLIIGGFAMVFGIIMLLSGPDEPTGLVLGLVGAALIFLGNLDREDPDCTTQNEPLTCQHYDDGGGR